MWVTRRTGGAPDLIDLDDARAHVRQIETDFDAEISRAIRAASAVLDVDADGFGGLGFPLVSSGWSLIGAGPPVLPVRLPFRRVASVDEIRVWAPGASAAEVWPATDWASWRDGRETLVGPMAGKSWPDLEARPDALEIRFTAGWATVADVPEDIKEACRLLVGHFFENRAAAVAVDVPREIALGVEALTARYRGPVL